MSTSLAVLLLMVYSLGGFVQHTPQTASKSKTEQKGQSGSNKQTEISQAQDFLAVNSSLSIDSHFEPFVFPTSVSFKYFPKSVFKAVQYFERNLHLKILFEHLIAPNAP